MAAADFYLGENDTSPVLQMTCYAPDGAVVDLTGASSIVFQLHAEDEESISVNVPAAAMSPPTAGKVQVAWAGYAAGRYEGRLKVTLAGGARMSFPNDRQLKIEITEDP